MLGVVIGMLGLTIGLVSIVMCLTDIAETEKRILRCLEAYCKYQGIDDSGV